MITTVTSNPAATRQRWLDITALFVLFVLLLLSMWLSLFIGTRTIDPGSILGNAEAILRGTTNPLAISPDLRVVSEQRIPRTLTGTLVGMCLGTAGALIQGHTRNPLADPGILGVSHGAAMAVVFASGFLGLSGFLGSVAWAFGGAIAATAVVFSLATIGVGKLNPTTLILAGAALSAVLASISNAIILHNSQALELIRFWSVGALTNANLTTIALFAPLVALGLVLAFATAPTINLLNLGDDIAQALGTNPQKARIIGVGIIAFLAAIATAAAGPIGFLGLVVPQIARAICGTDYRWLLPFSAVLGALLTVTADIIGRLIARPGEIEVGIVLAFVGAPVFMVLLYRNKVVTL